MTGPAVSRSARKAAAPARTSVLLVDDQAAIREGIRGFLGRERDLLVVGEARDGLEAVSMATLLDPDVVLMDIGMPRMNGIEATRRIREVAPRSRVLILSAHVDDDYILAVLAMGAVGYILKHSSLATLARQIRRTGRGGTVVGPMVRHRLRTLSPAAPRGGPAAGRASRA